MKPPCKKILSSLVFIFLFFGVSGQMRQLYYDTSGTQYNSIKSLSFYSASQGFFGAQGNPDWVGYTIDSGHTFIKRTISLSNVNFNGYNVNLTFGFDMEGIKAFSKDTIIAYGDYGFVPAILYSVNGGQGWTLVYHSQYNPLALSTGITSMVFPQNGPIGYAVDADRILKTTNKGLTWSPVTTLPNSWFDQVEGITDNVVFATSVNNNVRRILKTSNGGINWSQLTLPSGTLYSSHFINANEGWISMNTSNGGVIYYTSNGGLSWTAKNDPAALSFVTTKMKFLNSSTGFAIGGLYTIIKTTDGGKTWEPLPRDNQFEYLGFSHTDLQVLNSNQLWAGGYRDFLEISSNGGGTPLPKAYFTIDTAGLYSTGNVQLTNHSKTGYQYKWFVNNVQVATTFNHTYVHNIARSNDTLTLVVSNGSRSDTTTRIQYFVVPPLPSITSFYPATGSTGTLITINGVNFDAINGVRFGGVPASSFTKVSPTMITAVVGAGASGTVSVIHPQYGAFSVPGFSYFAPPSAPAPVVSSFAPDAAPIGYPITISGTNFNPIATGNKVFIGGMLANVVSGSATQLVCTVSPGTVMSTIRVLNTATGLSGESAKEFHVTFADSSNFTNNSFKYHYTFPLPPNAIPKGIKAYDFDQDGKPDLGLVNAISGWSDSIGVMRNNSSGGAISFEPLKTFGRVSTWGMGQFNVADIDGDGKGDLVAGTNEASVMLFRNTSTTGNINFAGPLTLPTAGGTHNIALHDFDLDGRPDIATSAFNSRMISFLRNTSNPGASSFGASLNLNIGDNPRAIKGADLDGDGKVDVVTSNSNSTFSVVRNISTTGNIAFAPSMNYPTGTSNPYGEVYVSDIDGDGKPDLLLGNADSLRIYRNISTAGNISFAAMERNPYTATEGSALSDFSGDSKPDLFFATYINGSFLRNNSVPASVAFNPPSGNLPGGKNIIGADMDMDGKVDLVSSNSYFVKMYRNQMGATLSFSLCNNQSYNLQSDLNGTAYQWQQDAGSGFMNLSNNANFSGVTAQTLVMNNLPVGTNGYKYRAMVDGLPSSTFIATVSSSPDPTVTMTASQTSICAGNAVTFTATPVNGGPTPYFTWQKNGITISGATNSTYTSTTLANGDKVRVILISSETCGNGRRDTSDVVTMTVGGSAPSIWFSASSNPVCANTMVTFTGNPTNAGPSPVYQWKRNGVNVGTNSPVYSTNSLVNGDTLKLEMTPSPSSCGTYATVSSGGIIEVKNPRPPQLQISANTTTICPGYPVIFTSTTSDGGSNPLYEWFKDGVLMGTTTTSYFITSSLVNSAAVTAKMTTNAACLSTNIATSNTINMTVYPVITPVVTISGNTTVSPGNSAFINSQTNVSGTFQWQDSSSLTGGVWFDVYNANAPNLNYTPLVNGSKLRVKFNSLCNPFVYSNTLTFTVTVPTSLNPVAAGSAGIHWYPNPVRSTLYVDSLKLSDRWETITITAMDGKTRLLQVSARNQTKLALDLSRLPAGVYVALLKRRDRVVMLRFVKLP